MEQIESHVYQLLRKIQCSAFITWSIFSQILTINMPVMTAYGVTFVSVDSGL